MIAPWDEVRRPAGRPALDGKCIKGALPQMSDLALLAAREPAPSPAAQARVRSGAVRFTARRSVRVR
jgi:hypothetical protein